MSCGKPRLIVIDWPSFEINEYIIRRGLTSFQQNLVVGERDSFAKEATSFTVDPFAVKVHSRDLCLESWNDGMNEGLYVSSFITRIIP